MIPRGMFIAMVISGVAIVVILLATPWLMLRYHVGELKSIEFEPRVIPMENHVGARLHKHRNRYTFVEIGTVRLAFLYPWSSSESLFELRTDPDPGADESPIPTAQGVELALDDVPTFSYGFQKGVGEGHVQKLAFRIRDQQLELGDLKLALDGDRHLVVVHRNGSVLAVENLEASGG